ncbi:uncharacterized protein LOC123511381 isoform X2 [Portunus trituberculatus]|uniref:Uncharacterized protein n=2 Tax=Portunus trituberculatus TaxID=210409 RepID=A0A5B7CS52_PORTR|nr:uncharacterized protein LOC123511381 isoform X2 [Portunus trituberculatus]MPC12055.1 hypothetical protein [Portunus trituberculatus]
MNDKGGMVKEEDEGQVSNLVKKEPQITVSSGHHLLGSKYREPKVVLKALPKSVLQKGTRKYPLNKREARVTLKRLGNSVSRKSNRIYTSKLHKQKPDLTKAVSAPSKSSKASVPKKELRVELEDISVKRPLQKRKGKRKRVSGGDEMQPKKKSGHVSQGVSVHRDKDEKTKEKADSRFDPDVMKKLFNFGAKVEEALKWNKEAVDKLTRNNDKVQSTLTQVMSDEFKDIDEKDILNILKWLEEEERQRKEHRQKVLESLRETHRTNIALYSHMLNVLQAVTASG